MQWAEKTDFPKVFKLRGGAGSSNVHLIRTKKQAKQFINKAFSDGFSSVSRIDLLTERLWHFKCDKNLKSLLSIWKGVARLFIPTELEKQLNNEKGYIYFQEFIPENSFDIRVIIIGKRAFGIKRMVRDNDFRASGSRSIVFDPKQISEECVKLAFDYTNRIIKNGGKIFLIPNVVIDYFARDKVSKLSQMFYQYGLFKPLVNKKLGSSATVRQFFPLLFVLLIILAMFFLAFQLPFYGIFLSGLGLYFMLAIIFAVKEGDSFSESLFIPILYFVLHVSYGFGYIRGIFRFLILKKVGIIVEANR